MRRTVITTIEIYEDDKTVKKDKQKKTANREYQYYSMMQELMRKKEKECR